MLKKGLSKTFNWGLNLVGLGVKKVFKYIGYGGDIVVRSDKTTTVIGKFTDKVNGGGIEKIKESGNFKYGENNGGINILNDPNWSWEKNKKWLDDAINRGDEIRLVSDPTNAQNLYLNGKDATKGLTTFGREIDYLKSNGYIQEGVNMIKQKQ